MWWPRQKPGASLGLQTIVVLPKLTDQMMNFREHCWVFIHRKEHSLGIWMLLINFSLGEISPPMQDPFHGALCLQEQGLCSRWAPHSDSWKGDINSLSRFLPRFFCKGLAENCHTWVAEALWKSYLTRHLKVGYLHLNWSSWVSFIGWQRGSSMWNLCLFSSTDSVGT